MECGVFLKQASGAQRQDAASTSVQEAGHGSPRHTPWGPEPGPARLCGNLLSLQNSTGKKGPEKGQSGAGGPPEQCPHPRLAPRPRTLPDAPGPLCALLLTPFKTPLSLSFLTLVVPRERMSAVVAAGTLSRLPVPRPHPGTRPALEGAVCSELPRDRMTLVCS